MQFIQTSNAPVPAGHYSQAVVANGVVYVSGILPIIPNTNKQMPDGISAQTEQVFKNMQATLQAANSNLDKLLNVQVFIPDIEYWNTVNEIFANILDKHKPARTIIPCSPLHYGALIEANATALVD